MWRLRIHTGIFSVSAPHSRIWPSAFLHPLLSFFFNGSRGLTRHRNEAKSLTGELSPFAYMHLCYRSDIDSVVFRIMILCRVVGMFYWSIIPSQPTLKIWTVGSILLRDVCINLFVCFLWRCDPTRAMASFLRFLDHTQRRITIGMTPLDE